jgi:20S proteasome alpha/beta subunit
MSDTEDSEFAAELEAAFVDEFGADEETAAAAAEKAATFREEHDEDLTVGDVTDRLADDSYESFEHRFDYTVGSLAAGVEDCTDSRQFRVAGFGDLAADPEQGA